MAYSTTWGILLIASAGISFAFGLYATNIIFRTTIDRLLMIVCVALMVWALGLAITVAADSTEIARIGYLIAPLGWGPMSGLLLHFTLLLTEKDGILKKWWIYVFLYLPGLLMVLGFTVIPAMGQFEDSFAHTIFGWVPVVNYDFWDCFFYLYYIIYTIVNLSVLIIARRGSRDENMRIQVTALAICYIIAYTLGTISDVVMGYLDVLIPRHSTVFSLIPLGAIVYIVKKHSDMSEKSQRQRKFFGIDIVHDKVYLIMGIAFGLGSIVNIVSQKLAYEEPNIPNINEFSIFLIAVSISIMIVNRLKINGVTKEMIISAIFALIIPYITLRYVRYGSISIWAFAFLLIIICLIYSRQILLTTITVTAFMTQLLVWAISPVVSVQVNIADYLVRLGFIGIAALFSFYVNSIYAAKLKENLSYTDKEAILSELARDFIAASDWNKDKIIYGLLEKCGRFVGSERAYVILFDTDAEEFDYFCEWLVEGTQSQWRDFESISVNDRKRLLKQFETERIMKLADTKLLPPFAKTFKKSLLEHNIRGIVNLAIKEKGEVVGIIGFNSSQPTSEWNIDSSDFLEIIANLLSDMLLKIKVEEKNALLAYYDQVTKMPNRILLMDRLEQAIKQAKRAKTIVGVIFIDVDSFKALNDTRGHDFGDKILFEIAKMLSLRVRSYDTVARFGGDEFVIILNQLSDEKDAIKIMDEIMNEVRKPFNLLGDELYVTISAGVALYPKDGVDPGTLIKNADIAMYNAKESGKNKFQLCL